MNDAPILRFPFAPEEHIEFRPQTPPVAGISSPQHGSRQLSPYKERPSFETADKGISRCVGSINTHPRKMLALPTPSVRLVDINVHREAGHMGMNPITLTGETGLLPGSWGDGKEYVKATLGCDSQGQTNVQKPDQSQVDARTRQLDKRKPDVAMIDMHELRTRYAQAVLSGNVFEDSSVEASPPLVMTQSRAVLSAAKSHDFDNDDDEWFDVSDDDISETDRKAESKCKLEDSGYSSGEAGLSMEEIDKTKRAAEQRKSVRFDEEAIEKQQKESKACRLLAHRTRDWYIY